MSPPPPRPPGRSDTPTTYGPPRNSSPPSANPQPLYFDDIADGHPSQGSVEPAHPSAPSTLSTVDGATTTTPSLTHRPDNFSPWGTPLSTQSQAFERNGPRPRHQAAEPPPPGRTLSGASTIHFTSLGPLRLRGIQSLLSHPLKNV